MSTTLCDPSDIEPKPTTDTKPRLIRTGGRSGEPVRVLHVINGEHYAGAERVQDLLALNLPSCGFAVSFAALKPGRFADARRSHETPLNELGMASRFDLRPAWQLAKLIRKQGISLVHTHTARSALIGRWASFLAQVPLVHHVHSPTSKDSTRGWQDKLNAAIERVSLWGVSSVIAVSHSLGAYAASRGIATSRISVVPNGVPIRGALTDRKPPTGLWTLGTVALFRPRKGLEVLLDAVAKLSQQGHDVRLRAVGEFETPEYQQQIMAQVERLGIGSKIHWTGFTQNVGAELAQMDVFVLPSLFGEGLPMVILEAMAAGVPIVATRVEGVPEAVRDGQEGLIAEPGDADDLARAIAKLIRGEADWSALRVAAHRRQAEHFSEESLAHGVAEVYRQVLQWQ